jgi:hypothetical protein
MKRWFPLTYALNSLNRSLGMPDGYPFTLAPPVVEKLRLVHRVIAGPPPAGAKPVDAAEAPLAPAPSSPASPPSAPPPTPPSPPGPEPVTPT